LNINAYIIYVVKPVGEPKQNWESNNRLDITGKNCGGVVLK
jgi:hypothetical protein